MFASLLLRFRVQGFEPCLRVLQQGQSERPATSGSFPHIACSKLIPADHLLSRNQVTSTHQCSTSVLVRL